MTGRIDAVVVLLAVQAQAKGDGVMSFYDLTANTLDGKPVHLSDYKGKVALVVNTASECGYTPQYAGLEKLYESYKDKGVVVLGFPSNDFGGQEPGTAAEIKSFCEKKFHVTFPMFAKIKVVGEGQSPVYTFLAADHGEPKWNFHKYVVGKDGQVRAAFASAVKPDSPELKSAIDSALSPRGHSPFSYKFRGDGGTPLFLTKLPGYRFDQKKECPAAGRPKKPSGNPERRRMLFRGGFSDAQDGSLAQVLVHRASHLAHALRHQLDDDAGSVVVQVGGARHRHRVGHLAPSRHARRHPPRRSRRARHLARAALP